MNVVRTCMERVRYSAPFAVYVLWLLAFPMDGVLSHCAKSPNFLLWFLVPHAITLLVTGRYLTGERIFPGLSRAGIVLTIAITALFPHFLGYHQCLAALAGISSAPLAIKACSRIKLSVKPFQSAAAGLVLGNVLLSLFIYLPLADVIEATILALLLILPLLSPTTISGSGSFQNLVKYLPFVFVFQLVSGLMYGFLMEKYAAQSLLNGSELLFYVLAVLGGIYIAGKRLDVLLPLGVLAAMFSFSFMLGGTVFGTNMSMYAMQSATGFMDLFLLCLLLSCEATSTALGYGLATGCLAIVCGKVLTVVAGQELSLIVSSGNVILTFAVLLLYFKSKKSESLASLCAEAVGPVQQNEPYVAVAEEDFNGCLPALPRGFNKRFSEKEKKVLEYVLEGKTFKEAAALLEISESSVKTYMKRIYEKTGVSSKAALVSLIDDLNGPVDRH